MNMHADGEQITAIDTRERILLTGATGFLGGSVAAQLIAAGHQPVLPGPRRIPPAGARTPARQPADAWRRRSRLPGTAGGADPLRRFPRHLLAGPRDAAPDAGGAGDQLRRRGVVLEEPDHLAGQRRRHFRLRRRAEPFEATEAFPPRRYRDVLRTAARVADQRVLGIPGGGAATGGLHRVQGGNRAAHARGTAGPAPGGGAAIHRGGPPYPWLPGLRQHLLGLPHGLRPGKLHLRPGRADRRDSGRLLRRGADWPGAEAVPGASIISPPAIARPAPSARSTRPSPAPTGRRR